MKHLTMTPFGRQPVTAGLVARARSGQEAVLPPRAEKWTLFRALTTARAAFGLRDRDLAVLAALLSFHPEADLTADGPMIVFPSNAALGARAHGMAESTLRRHLAALVQAGIIARHDSPNGKRYARRDRDGGVARAFGFDLAPMLAQAARIMAEAEAAEAAEETRKRLREDCVLMARDAVKLMLYGRDAGLHGTWDAYDDALRLHQRALRRKLSAEELAEMRQILAELRDEIACAVGLASVDAPQETENMSGKDADSGRHLQNSKPESSDLEPCHERAGGRADDPPPPIPLALVTKACPDVQDYRPDPIHSWQDLIAAAAFVHAMLGISKDAWEEAVRHMGAVTAAIVVACILQRVDAIQSPGGYLRSLTRKAADGAFSPGPMVMALLGPSGKRAA